MSCALLSESTSPAAWTAWTSVDSAGLALAAVATGAVLMPSKLPGPEVGTEEQAEPNGSAAIFARDGAAELVSEEPLEPEALLPEALSEPQAERVRATEALATSRALRVRRVRFTSVVLLQVSVRAQPSWPRRGRGVLRRRGGGS